MPSPRDPVGAVTLSGRKAQGPRPGWQTPKAVSERAYRRRASHPCLDLRLDRRLRRSDIGVAKLRRHPRVEGGVGLPTQVKGRPFRAAGVCHDFLGRRLFAALGWLALEIAAEWKATAR